MKNVISLASIVLASSVLVGCNSGSDYAEQPTQPEQPVVEQPTDELPEPQPVDPIELPDGSSPVVDTGLIEDDFVRINPINDEERAPNLHRDFKNIAKMAFEAKQHLSFVGISPIGDDLEREFNPSPLAYDWVEVAYDSYDFGDRNTDFTTYSFVNTSNNQQAVTLVDGLQVNTVVDANGIAYDGKQLSKARGFFLGNQDVLVNFIEDTGVIGVWLNSTSEHGDKTYSVDATVYNGDQITVNVNNDGEYILCTGDYDNGLVCNNGLNISVSDAVANLTITDELLNQDNAYRIINSIK